MPVSLDTIRITGFALSAVATFATSFRLWDRWRTARLWWDDVWAVFSLLFLWGIIGILEVHISDPTVRSQGAKIAVAMTLPHLFYSIVWSSRLALLLTVIRLSAGNFRRLLVWVGGLFVLFWVFLLAQVWWNCKRDTAWEKTPAPQCPLALDVIITQIVTDVVGDALLIFLPLWLVYRTKLNRAQKIRIIAIFSTTILITAFALYHAAWVFRGGFEEAFAATLQLTTTVIVVNFSVIMSFIFRIKTEEDDTAPHFTAPRLPSRRVTISYRGFGSTRESDRRHPTINFTNTGEEDSKPALGATDDLRLEKKGDPESGGRHVLVFTSSSGSSDGGAAAAAAKRQVTSEQSGSDQTFGIISGETYQSGVTGATHISTFQSGEVQSAQSSVV